MEYMYRKNIHQLIENNKQAYTDISDAIWNFAESRFQEVESSKVQQEYLKSRGFSVKADLSGEATAFIAEWGNGKPIIAYVGEFDALSALQQEADKTERSPIPEKVNGHGCGHHLLGTGSLAAADTLKTYMEEHGLTGTVRYYGCPAEENAGGKAYLVRDGYFNDCDVAMSWHPHTTNKVTGADRFLANFRVFFTFHGISSHAAGAPELGRSALDAVEIMDIGVNFMREHMIEGARIHGAITNTGGIAPNVIPAEAQVLYAIRAPKITHVKSLFDRMCDIAKGAALMTGTTVTIRQVSAYSNVVHNETMGKIMNEHLQAFVPMGYTEEELAYAAKFKEVITDLDKDGLKNMIAQLGDKEQREEMHKMAMLDFVLDRRSMIGGGGSTDVGDVSWVTPVGQANVNCFAAGTALHSWQAVAQGKSSIAHKGMLTAAKVLACTGVELLLKPELLAQVRQDWIDELGGEVYPNPLPKDLKPEIW
ncbi:MAG: amidohydrolase [Lachnospiraceae bacterium]|nr:amidohydrolase [Lachnospiraceae bacterium]